MYRAPKCLVTFLKPQIIFVHFYSDEHNYALCRFLYCTACTTYQMFHVFQLRIQVLTCATMPESCARILSNVLNMLFFPSILMWSTEKRINKRGNIFKAFQDCAFHFCNGNAISLLNLFSLQKVRTSHVNCETVLTQGPLLMARQLFSSRVVRRNAEILYLHLRQTHQTLGLEKMFIQCTGNQIYHCTWTKKQTGLVTVSSREQRMCPAQNLLMPPAITQDFFLKCWTFNEGNTE